MTREWGSGADGPDADTDSAVRSGTEIEFRYKLLVKAGSHSRKYDIDDPDAVDAVYEEIENLRGLTDEDVQFGIEVAYRAGEERVWKQLEDPTELPVEAYEEWTDHLSDLDSDLAEELEPEEQADLLDAEEDTESESWRDSAYYEPREERGGVDFSHVRGREEEIAQLQEVLGRGEGYQQNLSRLNNPASGVNGVLFYGPPGTGKSWMARAVANEYDYELFTVDGPELMDNLVGGSEENVRELFEAARNASPSLVVIDECEAIMSARRFTETSQNRDSVTSQMLSMMDGLHENEGVHVIGITNQKEGLDEAITRKGRLGTDIEFPAMESEEEIKEVAEGYFLPRQADIVAEMVGSTVDTFTHDQLPAIREEVGNAFKEHFAADGDEYSLDREAITDHVLETEVEKYDEGEPGMYGFGRGDAYQEAVESGEWDDLKDDVRDWIAHDLFPSEERLFTAWRHLNAIPDEVVRDGVSRYIDEELDTSADDDIAFQ